MPDFTREKFSKIIDNMTDFKGLDYLQGKFDRDKNLMGVPGIVAELMRASYAQGVIDACRHKVNQELQSLVTQ